MDWDDRPRDFLELERVLLILTSTSSAEELSMDCDDCLRDFLELDRFLELLRFFTGSSDESRSAEAKESLRFFLLPFRFAFDSVSDSLLSNASLRAFFNSFRFFLAALESSSESLSCTDFLRDFLLLSFSL